MKQINLFNSTLIGLVKSKRYYIEIEAFLREKMSFLKKLKEKLFKSSSKIKDGVEELVREGDSAFDQDATNKGLEELELSPSGSVDQPKRKKPEPIKDSKKVNSGAPKKESLIAKFVKKVDKPQKRLVDDAMLENLEDLLISSDLGVGTALKISASFSEIHYGKRLSAADIKKTLAAEIKDILVSVAKPIPIFSEDLQIILVVGVNGSGKTTTIGKLASQFKSVGKKVKIVAADTFRAAAVEQLEVWGERARVPVIKAAAGADPAALSYDAVLSAQKDGTDILIIDTAGRLQNKTDLMEELAKIIRVLKKVNAEAPHNTLLVLDASTGQNALSQVEIFQQTAQISGLIMTKLDGTAKGGVLVALADKYKLPIHAIGIGETIEDLQPFEPEDFTLALVGVD